MFTKSQEFVAELVGTMVLILFGCGVCAMVGLFASSPAVPGEVVKGGFTNICLGWGLAVTMGIYVSGRISGAHLNPAVTLGLAATGRFPWGKVGYYIVAQTIGAFIGAAIVYAVFKAKWVLADPGYANTAWIFATFPAVPGFWPGFIDQVVGTALLVGLIFAITDSNNTPAGGMAPFIIGLVVVAIGISFGGMHGYAINPARDFGPRIFAVLAGFPNNGLTDGTNIWLVPIIGPMVGGVVGAFFYDLTVGKAMRQK